MPKSKQILDAACPPSAVLQALAGGDPRFWIKGAGKLCSLALECLDGDLRLTEVMDWNVIPAKAGIQ